VATEWKIREFLQEMESLIDADDGTVFVLQHIDAVADLTSRLDASEKLHGDYYEL
jgi:hypothetical protein